MNGGSIKLLWAISGLLAGSAAGDSSFQSPVFQGSSSNAAPAGNYAAGNGQLSGYGSSSNGGFVSHKNGNSHQASYNSVDQELAALQANIPGVPGEDYPIFAEVPETSFTCDGLIPGGDTHKNSQ